MNIQGKFITLRAIEEQDLLMLRDMLNDSELEHQVVGWSHPISLTQQKEWYVKDLKDPHTLRLIIDSEGIPSLGVSILNDIDWKNRTADHGIKLRKDVFQKGIGTDTIMAIMRYAFDELQLKKLEASWLKDNIASERLHIKCGWTVEGVKRNHVFKNGKYHDLIIGGILEEEYRNFVNKSNYWQK